MKDIIKKYGSRKFLLTLFTNVLGIATILSGYGGKIGLIASITAIVVTTAIYITNERKIDVEAVTKIIKLSIDDYEKIKKKMRNNQMIIKLTKKTKLNKDWWCLYGRN